eukprot:CAMPEP_0117649208 /NCGR_PEP_ID=MMETSP0804-20121206/843_1 /TAXON_ID=1074897 /ORGANISM="Tetraselmis astigmatica, Strain CCMP880" /LENGTH=96 /DNA_ID=CAMNT_0005454917 /DNA_START=415 /DNA_END=706 /DNA_ORIENTATION=-
MAKEQKRKCGVKPESLEISAFEPWVAAGDWRAGVALVVVEDIMAAIGFLVDTSIWDNVKNLTWREVKALPVRTFNAFYKESFTNTNEKTREETFVA